MNGSRRTIIGVMPRGFVFRSREVDFWNPMQFTPAEATTRSSHFLNVVARLSPGVTLERAREDMHDVARRLAAEYPSTNARVGAVVIPLKEDLLGDKGLQLVVLMAAAGCVLLIACANIASLLLSRAMARRNEMAVRAALGATSGRLARQMVVEALILALAGGALGVLLVPAGMTVLAAMVPDGVMPSAVSILDVRAAGIHAGAGVRNRAAVQHRARRPRAHARSINPTLQHGGRHENRRTLAHARSARRRPGRDGPRAARRGRPARPHPREPAQHRPRVHARSPSDDEDDAAGAEISGPDRPARLLRAGGGARSRRCRAWKARPTPTRCRFRVPAIRPATASKAASSRWGRTVCSGWALSDYSENDRRRASRRAIASRTATAAIRRRRRHQRNVRQNALAG